MASEKIGNIMYACIILHIMILEDQEHTICGVDQNDFEVETQISEEQRAINVREVRNQEIHLALRGDLVEHIWISSVL